MRAVITAVCAGLPAVCGASAGAQEPTAPPDPNRLTDPMRECPAQVAEARKTLLEGAPPFAVMSSSGALARDCTVLAFYGRAWLKGAELRFEVRKWQALYEGVGAVAYADSRTCPKTINAVRALESFRPAGVLLPSLHPSSAMRITIDGSYYSFWSDQARGNVEAASTFEVYAEGWNYPALDTLTGKVMQELSACWSDKAPEFP